MINKFKNKLSNDLHFAELFKGASIVFIFKIAGVGLGYIFTLLIARWYGAETMGLYALSLTILNIFVTMGVFGFDNTLIKLVPEYNSNKKSHLIKELYVKVLSIAIPSSLMLSAILYLYADFFAETIFKKEDLSLFLQITAISIVPFVVLRINTALFRGMKDVKFFSLFDGFGISLFSVIGLLTAYTFFNIIDNIIVIVVQVIAIILLVIISIISIQKYRSIYKTISKNMLKYSEIITVSFPILLASSVALIMSWTDVIMIGIFRNEEEVGIYSAVLKIAALTSIILMVVGSILGPKISEFYAQKDFKNLEIIVRQSTKLIFFTSLPILILLLIFPNYIMGIFGEEFKIGTTALIILAVGQLFYVYSGDAGMFLKMTNNQVFLLKLNVFALSLNIILNYFLINSFGINGAAVATMTALIIAKILANRYIKQKYNFNFYLKLNKGYK